MYKRIRPGKVWYDTKGQRIQAHGGSIIFCDNKFWWYGENKEGITGRATGEVCPFWHHGIRLYSSEDLYNWEDMGICAVESNDIEHPFHPSNVIERPHIIYNNYTKQYVMWVKAVRLGHFSTGGFAVCVGETIKSFRYLKTVIPTPHHSGDFDIFVIGEKAYIIYENPHSELVARELTEDYTDLTNIYSTHIQEECPPYVREAPAHFERGGRHYILTSGTTGYYPNPTLVYDITDIHGKWINLGYACVNDKAKNSFNCQFSSVFKHPTVKDLYIALGDRWLTDLVIDLPDMEQVFYAMFSKKKTGLKVEGGLETLTDENTSEANYVWLPIKFTDKGPQITWYREWSVEEQ